MRMYDVNNPLGAHPASQNGKLDGGKYKVSTIHELVAYMNSLAKKVGIFPHQPKDVGTSGTYICSVETFGK